MNRWYFWVLAPIMLATGLGLPFIVDTPPTPLGTVVLYLFCGTLVIATLGLARPRRFQWALKIVAGMILLAYVSYVVGEFIDWRNGQDLGWSAPRSRATLPNAILGLFVYGVPSLYFILKGRSGSKVDVLLDVDEDQS